MLDAIYAMYALCAVCYTAVDASMQQKAYRCTKKPTFTSHPMSLTMWHAFAKSIRRPKSPTRQAPRAAYTTAYIRCTSSTPQATSKMRCTIHRPKQHRTSPKQDPLTLKNRQTQTHAHKLSKKHALTRNACADTSSHILTCKVRRGRVPASP